MLPSRALGQLSRTFLKFYPERKSPFVVSLTAYFDESERGGEYAVAGYLSHTEMWDQVFQKPWMHLIENAVHPISEFKASDCRAQEGEFAPWARPECNDLTKGCVDVVINAVGTKHLVGFGAAVAIPEAFKSDTFSQSAFGLCVGIVFSQAILLFKKMRTSDTDELLIVVDEKRGFHRKMMESFETVRDGVHGLSFIERPVSRQSHRFPGLQAADLLAYETRKEIQSRIEACRDEAPPIRPVSKALERLVEGRQHFAQVIDAPFLMLSKVARERNQPPPEPKSLYSSGYGIRDRFPNAWTMLYADEE